MKTSKLRARLRAAESSLKYLKGKIQSSTETLGVNVDDSLHSGLEGIWGGRSA